MLLNPDDPKLKDPRRPKPAPAEFAGQWVAWNEDRSHVLAHGNDVAAVRTEAVQAGHKTPLMEKVPEVRSFIGGA